MGKIYDHIPESLYQFMLRNHLFYVASAPLEGGSVNVSPKANENGCFEIVDSHRVRYLDLTGSGNETVSHLLQPGNGRITVMFVNIEEGAPRIVRLFGKGSVHERGSDPDFDRRWREARGGQDVPFGGRAIIDIAVHTCTTSCGYSMPIYEFKKPRTVLDDYMAKYDVPGDVQELLKKKGRSLPEGAGVEEYDGKWRPFARAVEGYWALENKLSLDGLPGLRSVRHIIDLKELQALLDKKDRHDALEAPSDHLGPIKAQQARGVVMGQVAARYSGMGYIHLFFAFLAGCALTSSILLAQRA